MFVVGAVLAAPPYDFYLATDLPRVTRVTAPFDPSRRISTACVANISV